MAAFFCLRTLHCLETHFIQNLAQNIVLTFMAIFYKPNWQKILRIYIYYTFFQVRSVLIKSCEDLMVGLDLTGVNPMEIPIKFKNCGKISFSYINFDQQFSGGQLLELVMETVSSVKLEGLDVKDALQVRSRKYSMFY